MPSRDGKALYYAADRVGPPDIMLKVLDDPAEDQTLFAELGVQAPNDVSPDGALLLYSTDHDPAMRYDLWILPLAVEAKPYPFVRSPYNEFGGRFSPDGTRVAYVSNESGRNQVHVRPFPGPGPALQVSQSSGSFPRWSRDGRSLLYISDGKLLRSVPPFSGAPQVEVENRDMVSFELAPDEKRILALTTSDFDASPPTRVITNWRTLLEKRGK